MRNSNRRGTSKSNGRKDSLDRFYMQLEEAERLVSALLDEKPEYHGRIFVEPSAGRGAFVKALEEHGETVIAYDIAPSESSICATSILKRDFLATANADIEADVADVNGNMRCE